MLMVIKINLHLAWNTSEFQYLVRSISKSRLVNTTTLRTQRHRCVNLVVVGTQNKLFLHLLHSWIGFILRNCLVKALAPIFQGGLKMYTLLMTTVVNILTLILFVPTNSFPKLRSGESLYDETL